MVSGIMHPPAECDKRVRREIANSNERRRMQSINTGFEQLKVLLPAMSDSDKISKANILKLTAKYINSLVNRINHLENEVASYRADATDDCVSLFSKKRKIVDKETINVKQPRRTTALVVRHDSPECSPFAMPHLSPVSSAPSFCNESQHSPESCSEGSNAARLEHLVMAIEKIEGDFTHTQQDSDDDDWTSYMNQSKNTPAAVSTFPLDAKQPLNGGQASSTSCIPHKYLHRPQVVVNSSG